jgi:hypothetical protein
VFLLHPPLFFPRFFPSIIAHFPSLSALTKNPDKKPTPQKNHHHKKFHAKPFREEWFNATRDPADTADPGDCEDLHAQCSSWAKSGECDRNPQYMRGDDGHLGRCRASCKACEACGKKPAGAGDGDGDAVAKYKSCRALNRHKAGYLVYDQDFDDPDEGVAAGLEALRRAGVAATDGASVKAPPTGAT